MIPALIALGVVLVLVLAAVVVSLRSPEGRHAWGEARWRAGGTWQDFVDWLRIGR